MQDSETEETEKQRFFNKVEKQWREDSGEVGVNESQPDYSLLNAMTASVDSSIGALTPAKPSHASPLHSAYPRIVRTIPCRDGFRELRRGFKWWLRESQGVHLPLIGLLMMKQTTTCLEACVGNTSRYIGRS